MLGSLIGIFLTSAGIVIGADSMPSTFSVQEAKALYQTVVRATIDHADRFLMDGSEVGGRLHLFTIPPAGPIEEEFIAPEQYVKGFWSPDGGLPTGEERVENEQEEVS